MARRVEIEVVVNTGRAKQQLDELSGRGHGHGASNGSGAYGDAARFVGAAAAGAMFASRSAGGGGPRRRSAIKPPDTGEMVAWDVALARQPMTLYQQSRLGSAVRELMPGFGGDKAAARALASSLLAPLDDYRSKYGPFGEEIWKQQHKALLPHANVATGIGTSMLIPPEGQMRFARSLLANRMARVRIKSGMSSFSDVYTGLTDGPHAKLFADTGLSGSHLQAITAGTVYRGFANDVANRGRFWKGAGQLVVRAGGMIQSGLAKFATAATAARAFTGTAARVAAGGILPGLALGAIANSSAQRLKDLEEGGTGAYYEGISRRIAKGASDLFFGGAGIFAKLYNEFTQFGIDAHTRVVAEKRINGWLSRDEIVAALKTAEPEVKSKAAQLAWRWVNAGWGLEYNGDPLTAVALRVAQREKDRSIAENARTTTQFVKDVRLGRDEWAPREFTRKDFEVHDFGDLPAR